VHACVYVHVCARMCARMCVCPCVCTYVCTHMSVCPCVCTYVCTHMSAWVCTWVLMCIHEWEYIYSSMFTCICVCQCIVCWHTRVCMSVCVCWSVSVYVCMCVGMSVCECVWVQCRCIQVWMCVYACMIIHAVQHTCCSFNASTSRAHHQHQSSTITRYHRSLTNNGHSTTMSWSSIHYYIVQYRPSRT
jgi:hypothetical protein